MKKKTYRELERENKRLKEGVQVEVVAFRRSAEMVLNELIVQVSRAQLLEISATSLIKDVAYGRKTKFDAKRYIDEKLDKVHEFKGTHLEFLEWLEIEGAEEVFEKIEADVARLTQDYAIKLFMHERELLKSEN